MFFWWRRNDGFKRVNGLVYASNGKRRFSRWTRNGYVYTFAYSQAQADKNFNFRHWKQNYAPLNR
jgi:hypothetical protein